MLPTPYLTALTATRDAQDSNSSDVAAEIEKEVLIFITTVIAALKRHSTPSTSELATIHHVIEYAAQHMYTGMSDALASGLEELGKQVSQEWEKASDSYAFSHGGGVVEYAALFGLVVIPERWRTLLAQYTRAGAREVYQLITSSFAQRIGVDDLAIALRRYVSGGQPFRRVFGDAFPSPPDAAAANAMKFNATRIAVTTLQDMRGAAEVEAFIRDPYVKAVLWQLSPNRGTQTSPDECDLLAKGDYYGLGVGVFPVTQVPNSPHPFDRCERVPVVRPFSEGGSPKPNPARIRTPYDVTLPNANRLSPRALERAKESALRAMDKS